MNFNTIAGLLLLAFAIWFAWDTMSNDNYTNRRGGF